MSDINAAACAEKRHCYNCSREDQQAVYKHICCKVATFHRHTMLVAKARRVVYSLTYCTKIMTHGVADLFVARSHMHCASLNFAMVVHGHHASQNRSISSINKHICGRLSLRGWGQAGGHMMQHSTKAHKPMIHSSRQGCYCHDHSIAPSLAASPGATHTATQGKPASRTAFADICETMVAA